MKNVTETQFKAASRESTQEVMASLGWQYLSDEDLAALHAAAVLRRLPTLDPPLLVIVARNCIVPWMRGYDANALNIEAEKLAAEIAEQRRQNPEPVEATAPVAVKVRSRAYRLLQFPKTMRRFERVFFAQGVPRFERWLQAWRMARLTVKKPRPLDTPAESQ